MSCGVIFLNCACKIEYIKLIKCKQLNYISFCGQNICMIWFFFFTLQKNNYSRHKSRDLFHVFGVLVQWPYPNGLFINRSTDGVTYPGR